MTADWESTKEVFAAALELPARERESFVKSACHGDPEAIRHVQELLLADAASEASSFLGPEWLATSLSSLTLPASVQPGDTLCGRYLILRLIAEGGMGRVYEAHDQELNVRIALKTIHPEIASVPGVLARFRQEVRIAHRVTHPNVCRTFNMERETRRDPATGAVTDEVVFLTMEYLEGESLAQRLRSHGRMELAEALALAKQLSEALTCAHALGVVHRDIKPANVMLVPSLAGPHEPERAVITDFGLARVDAVVPSFPDARTSLSVVGAAMGTLAYMAPEQLQGEAVSPATDIYAFGLLLFEMVTGTKAFPDSQSVLAAMRRVDQPAPSARAVLPGLPAVWETAIDRCLQPLPADRPAHVADVILSLEGELSLPRKRRRSPSVLSVSRPLAWTALAGALAVVSLFVLGLRYWGHTADSHVAAGALVYMAPVSNTTGEAELNNVSQLIQAGLTQSGQVNLLDDSRADDILQQMTKPPDTPITPPIAREIAMRASAVRVVFATVTGGKGTYTLNVDIQQPDGYSPARYRNHWEKSFTWQMPPVAGAGDTIPQPLLASVRDASGWIRHEVGESADDIARLDAPPEDVTTSSWQALENYTFALKLESQGKTQDAVTALRSAVRIDPTFALAYARLGDLLMSLDQFTESYEAYLKALDQPDGHSLSLRERDRIQGIYSSDTYNFQAAEDAFREYASVYPNDYVGWFYRGAPLLNLNRGREALTSLERAHKVDPRKTNIVVELSLDSLVLDDPMQARHWLSELHSMGAKEEAQYVDGLVHFANKDFEGAKAVLFPLSQSRSDAHSFWALRWLVDMYAERGEYDQAISLLTQSIAGGMDNYRLFLDRADLFCRLKDRKGCIQDINKAIIQAKGSDDVLLDASRILGRAAFGSSALNRKEYERALALLEARLSPASYGTISALARSRIRGELLLADGNVSGALEEFNKADKLDPPIACRDYLSRALSSAADQERDPEAVQRLRRRAMELLRPVAFHEGPLWQWQDDYPPGFYADQLEAWMRVAQKSGAERSEVDDVRSRLTAVRPGPSNPL